MKTSGTGNDVESKDNDDSDDSDDNDDNDDNENDNNNINITCTESMTCYSSTMLQDLHLFQ